MSSDLPEDLIRRTRPEKPLELEGVAEMAPVAPVDIDDGDGTALDTPEKVLRQLEDLVRNEGVAARDTIAALAKVSDLRGFAKSVGKTSLRDYTPAELEDELYRWLPSLVPFLREGVEVRSRRDRDEADQKGRLD